VRASQLGGLCGKIPLDRGAPIADSLFLSAGDSGDGRAAADAGGAVLRLQPRPIGPRGGKFRKLALGNPDAYYLRSGESAEVTNVGRKP
jgi:hypothetical protein